MFVTRHRILALALLLNTVWCSESIAARCLHYGDVTLTGRLVRQTYPGPPDFESVTKGDQPIVIWVLQLDSGVCIVTSDASHPNTYNEREVQLVLDPEYRRLLGKKIAVTGRLLPGGGKYEKPFVITSPAIKELF